MDQNLVRSWLGLPPGSWPPDHYTLLGLPPGRSDSTAIETIVLDRMDKLRRHQLLHPELVTEGMNRLAQALITLTDPSAKAAYDSEQGIAATTTARPAAVVPKQKSRHEEPARAAPVVIARPVIDEVFPDDAPVGLPANLHDTQELFIPSFEVVEATEPRAGTLVVSDQEVLDVPAASSGRSVIDAAIVEALPVGVSRDADAKSRRWIYARLALLRKAIRGWERLRPIVADTEDRLERPGRVLILLEAIAELRPLLPHLRGIIGGIGETGGIVVALVTQPIMLDTFRRLLPDQRQAVAGDWLSGQTELRREYQRLRQLTRHGRGQFQGSTASLQLGRWLRDNPEWILILLALFAIFIAVLRVPAGS